MGVCMLAWLSLTPGITLGQSTAKGAASHPLYGVNIDGPTLNAPASLADREIAWAKALHANVVRTEIPWSVLEPAAAGQLAPGPLAFTDRLTADAAASGIRVIMLVESTPCWASSAPPAVLRKCSQTRLGPANSWSPQNPSAYGAFTAFLAQRYASSLAAIEVWNEPDQSNEHYLAGPHKPQRYAAILKAAYPAIKAAAPSVQVLGASLVGSNGAFLRALYAAGIKGYYDGLSVHFYNLTIASLRSIHETQLAYGDTTPLWLDEFGWSSCWPHYRVQQEQPCVSRQQQASNLTDTYRALARMPYVQAAVMYKLASPSTEDFGVLTAGWSKKPSFASLAAVLANPYGEVPRPSLAVRRRGGQLVAAGSAPPGDFMELEVLRGTEPRYRAIFILNRFNRYSIALPSVLGTSGLTVRVFQYGLGEAHAAQRTG